MNRARLEAIAQCQSEWTILDTSQKGYLCKLKVMTEILDKILDVREDALVINAVTNKAETHTGAASKILVLKLPMSVSVGKYLFAAISIDGNLPRKKNNVLLIQGVEVANDPELLNNPGKNIVTVTAQTYQNYKSGLVFWHEYDCPAYGKTGYPWPSDLDDCINKQIATYKRDIGSKKRRNVMKQKEGKSPYNIRGYFVLCDAFNRMRPISHKCSWNEGMFASLFTKLSVNTIGRSDNIDDQLLTNMGWENDAMTIKFGTTKSDQAGETTSEIKRLMPNPFQPRLCVVHALAVYTWCKRRSKFNLFNYLKIKINIQVF